MDSPLMEADSLAGRRSGENVANGNGNGSRRFLSPRFIQAVGVAVFVVSVAIWAITSRQSALLVSASLSLIGVGTYQNAVDSLKKVVPTTGEGGGNGERGSIEHRAD